MHPSDMIVIGSRPGVGKTAFGLSVLQNLAKTGKRVGFISTEMGSQQVMLRIAAANSGISGSTLRDASLQDDEWPLLTAAINKVANLDFRINDKPSVTVSDVSLQCKAWMIDGGLDFVAIDYLTRIKPVKSSGNQTNDVAEVVTGLKNIARQLDIPVMVLAQLNRNVANRKDPRPCMADLRDSGVVEQEADTILLLYRPDDDTAPAQIIIDKNRHGECADVLCQYQPQTMQWLNLLSNYQG
jgi:replicative DNA helicase